MTRFNPRTRPTIHELLNDPMFANHPKKLGIIHCKKISSLPKSACKIIQDRIHEINVVDQYPYVQTLIDLCINLYSMAKDIHINSINTSCLLDTCIWITYKLTTGRAPKALVTPPPGFIPTPAHLIFKTEQQICNCLGYQLHRCSNNELYIKIGSNTQ